MKSRMQFKNIIIIISLALAAAACQKPGLQRAILDESMQKTNPLGLQISKPDTIADLRAKKILVEVITEHPELIKSMHIKINDKQTFSVNGFPFSLTLPEELGNVNQMKVSVSAQDFSDRTFEISKFVGETGHEPGGPPINGGVIDPQCMASSAYDACIFWKSPLAMRGKSFSPAYSFGSDLSAYQTFGVNLSTLKDPDILSSADFRIINSDTDQPIKKLNNTWKIDYQRDSNSKLIASIMAFHYLTQAITELSAPDRMGKFWAKAKNIKVFPFDSSISNNAFWDQSEIHSGVSTQNGGEREVANGGDVLVHELAHANLQFATSGAIYTGTGGTTTPQGYCRSANGCIGAINEGQADFHTFMVFKGDPIIGEDFMNSPTGFSERNPSHNSQSAQSMFQSSHGEVHAMGAIYSAILWQAYTDSAMTRSDFEKIFGEHLLMLKGSSSFTSARDNLLTAVDVVVPASTSASKNSIYKAVIEKAFSDRGI